MPLCRPIDTHGHPIFLIGMMGSGKTTVGKELSRLTGLPLLDMDSIIEEQIGKSIPEIFRDSGEAHFRALETALLRYIENYRVPPLGAAIISTGGGVVLSPINREIMKRVGFVVWLDVDTEAVIERTSRASNRPLLNTENRQAVIDNLIAQRAPLYEDAAHLRIETARLEVLAVVDVVHDAAVEFFSHSEY
ncbi:MAG: shikimate kinase [Akkermansiaceae bacterium]|nr:shikimate kinase [Akkermansiaceae bacterium]